MGLKALPRKAAYGPARATSPVRRVPIGKGSARLSGTGGRRLARRTIQVEKNARFGLAEALDLDLGRAARLGLLQAKEVGQRQPERTEAASLQHVAARPALTKS